MARERATTPPSVFLSYQIADADVANRLRARLTDEGLHVYTAADVATGASDFLPSPARLLADADAVVVLLSEPASAFVEAEAQAAVEQGLRVIPVRLGGAPLPAAVADLQALELPDAERLLQESIACDVARAHRAIETRLTVAPSFWLYAMQVDADLLTALAGDLTAEEIGRLARDYLSYRTVGSPREFDSVYAQMDFIAEMIDDEGVRAQIRALRKQVEDGVRATV